jgi:hypothetical protein
MAKPIKAISDQVPCSHRVLLLSLLVVSAARIGQRHVLEDILPE